MTFHVRLGVCLAPALFGAVPAPATAQGYKGYPYSIMTPRRRCALPGQAFTPARR